MKSKKPSGVSRPSSNRAVDLLFEEDGTRKKDAQLPERILAQVNTARQPKTVQGGIFDGAHLVPFGRDKWKLAEESRSQFPWANAISWRIGTGECEASRLRPKEAAAAAATGVLSGPPRPTDKETADSASAGSRFPKPHGRVPHSALTGTERVWNYATGVWDEPPDAAPAAPLQCRLCGVKAGERYCDTDLFLEAIDFDIDHPGDDGTSWSAPNTHVGRAEQLAAGQSQYLCCLCHRRKSRFEPRFAH